MLIQSLDDYVMNPGTIAAAGRSLIVEARGAIQLGSISGEAVRLTAGSDILDNDPTTPVHITADSLAMTAGGTIGQADPLSVNPDSNSKAIDVNTPLVSALSSSGIYLQQVSSGGNLI